MIAFGLYIFGAIIMCFFVISLFLLFLTYGSEKDKKWNWVRLILLYLCIGFMFCFGTYKEVEAYANGFASLEDLIPPAIMYTNAMLLNFAMFFRHNTNEKYDTLFEMYWGGFMPSFNMFRLSSYFFFVTFIIESILRICSDFSMAHSYFVTQNISEELIPYIYYFFHECAYYVLAFCVVCMLLEIHADWSQKGQKCLTPFIKITCTSVLLIVFVIGCCKIYNMLK